MKTCNYANSYHSFYLVSRDFVTSQHYCYSKGYVWEKWFHMIQPVSTLVPYMVGTGNHEYDHTDGGRGRDPSGLETEGGWKPKWFNGGGDSNGECGVPIHNRFHMPDNGNSLFWYGNRQSGQ